MLPAASAIWPIARVVLLGGITGAGLLGTVFGDWKEERARQKAVNEQTQQALIIASQEEAEATKTRFADFQTVCDKLRLKYEEEIGEISESLEEDLDLIPPVREGGVPCPRDCVVP